MRKPRSKFVCQQCGGEFSNWFGRCPSCSSWNSLVEEVEVQIAASVKPVSARGTAPVPVRLADIPSSGDMRSSTGLEELDRVLGGGIVPGSAVLVSGEPGIGKSTLLLQAASRLAEEGTVLYVSGEESVRQMGMRARRIKASSDRILVVAETCVQNILEAVASIKPSVLIVDSIQTLQDASLSSAAGSVGQVRQCASILIEAGKSSGMAVFLVGHVTKTGAVAGPKVLEHMVDTVLQFEGGMHQAYRVVRTLKNRFGSTDEVGVFEMGEEGLVEVRNPSEAFLRERAAGMAGSIVVPCMEGTRPFMVEVQALVGSPAANFPRRTSSGVDQNRVAIMLAVLGRRVGMPVEANDTFLNVAGGITVDEPAADLGIAAALASGFRNRAIGNRIAVFGEVGLSGELRSVTRADVRVAEAVRLGFTGIVMPKANLSRLKSGKLISCDAEMMGFSTLAQALDYLVG